MNDRKIALRTAIPTVHNTKSNIPGGTYIEVRAEDVGEGLSLHYHYGVDNPGEIVPRVRETLLAAVIQGAPIEWLWDEGEAIRVRLPSFRASSNERRADAVTIFQNPDGIRLEFEPPSESVELDADEAVVLVAALLGILRRML